MWTRKICENLSAVLCENWPCSNADDRSTLGRDVFVALEYMIRYVLLHSLPRDVDILHKYESLGRVARSVVVVYRTEHFSALFQLKWPSKTLILSI